MSEDNHKKLSPELEAVRQGIIERLSRPMPPQVVMEIDTCSLVDKLGVSLQALRMALEAANQAPGVLGLPDENGHLTEACELRSRWHAALQLLTAAITSVESDAGDLIQATKASLGIE
jgi:hypothetical protein